YTYVGDVVLDPFMGSGSTAVAAVRTGRHYIGYDTDAGYAEAAHRRAAAAQPVTGAVSLPAGGDRSGDPQRAGWSANELARWHLAQAGFGAITEGAAVAPGVPVTFRAVDPGGTTWWFEVAGGRTGSRPGLQRAEVLWRAIAKGTVAAAA